MLAVRGVLDSEGGMCALCSFLSMYFFKSGPVAAGMGTEGDEGSPVLRVAEEIVSAGRERSGPTGRRTVAALSHTCLGVKKDSSEIVQNRKERNECYVFYAPRRETRAAAAAIAARRT